MMENLNITDTELLVEVIRFASEKHKYQTRKDGRIPYINHPIEVAYLLVKVGETDAALLAAALLHDTIEDTKTSDKEILERFGQEVLNIVKEVTDDKKLSKYERKQAQIDHAPHLSRSAKLLKLADKTCNVQDIIKRPPGGWSVKRKMQYLDWAEAVVNGMRNTNEELENLFDEYVAKGRRVLNEALVTS